MWTAKGQEMESETLIRLSAGPLRLALSPSIGGAISAFEWTGETASRPILRNCNRPLENVLEAASFPLVPFVNRIRGGRFAFRGRDVRIAPNMAGDPSPLHGQGWLSPWQVESARETAAVLSFRHEPGDWPWAYDASQDFALDERGLSVGLTCRNAGAEPMPCGLGQHPYFPCGPETRIDTRVADAWTVDADVLPVDKVVADGRYDLRERAVCGQDLDNGFGGWNGEARLTDPDWPYDLVLSSLQARFFQLYSPAAGGIFVAEPVTHANAALNAPEADWAELGLRVLEPGETMSLDMRLEVTPK
ncbi:MAG: aldose 1-epimerase [Sphingomicrobium sp.]